MVVYKKIFTFRRQTPPFPPAQTLPFGQTLPCGQIPTGRQIPWADTPPEQTPPLGGACWDTVNKRAVGILLEFILVGHTSYGDVDLLTSTSLRNLHL